MWNFVVFFLPTRSQSNHCPLISTSHSILSFEPEICLRQLLPQFLLFSCLLCLWFHYKVLSVDKIITWYEIQANRNFKRIIKRAISWNDSAATLTAFSSLPRHFFDTDSLNQITCLFPKISIRQWFQPTLTLSWFFSSSDDSKLKHW